VAAAFYVATLSPVLGFIMLYTFFYTFVADHYQYVASIGPIALASAAIAGPVDSLKWKTSQVTLVLGAGVLMALGTLSWRQARVYRDAETIWADTLSKNAQSWLAHNNLGNVLVRQGNVDGAIAHYQTVLQIKPDYAVAEFNLGNAYAQEGREGEAITHFRFALQISPDYPRAESNLAFLLATSPDPSLRDGRQAVVLAERAVQALGEESPITLRALAAAYAEAGRFSDARRSARNAIELAQAAGQVDLAATLDAELKLYAEGIPFHRGSK
jgi:tetratricopeptide (TPR) repeat protein